MLGQPIQWSHVGILATTYSRYAIRGGSGLIFLLAFLMVGLSIAGILIDPLKTQVKEFKKQGKQVNRDIKDKDVVDVAAKTLRPVVAWWVDAEEERGPDGKMVKTDPLVEHLVVTQPPIFSAYLLILFAFIPFTTCLGAFNQLAGDIGTKGLRYLLLRTERINIIVARFLGTVIFTTVISLAVIAVVITYIALTFDSHTFGELLIWGLRGWFAILLFSLPYICLCTLLSAMLDSAIATLVLCLLATGFPIVFLKIAWWTAGRKENLNWLDRLTPWGWKYELLHPEFAKFGLAAVVMLAFSAAFWFLAVRCFLKRDL